MILKVFVHLLGTNLYSVTGYSVTGILIVLNYTISSAIMFSIHSFIRKIFLGISPLFHYSMLYGLISLVNIF